MNSRRFVSSKTFILFSFIVLFVSQNSFANAAFLEFRFFPDSVKDKEKTNTITRPRVIKSSEEIEQAPETANNEIATDKNLEREVFDLINQQRAATGLPQLKWNDEVAKIARLHSENMAKFHFFSHQGLDGLQVNDRADLLGISNWRSIGENIAYNQGYDHPGEFAVERWMQSPGHKENVLNNRWKETGIGVAISKDKRYYFTQVFLLRH